MDLVARYLDHVRFEKRLAERTVTLYSLDLEKLIDYAAQAHVALEAVQSVHIRRWVAQMHSGGRSGRGIALILSGWRGFYVWLGRQGVVTSNPVQDVRAPKAAKPLPKALSVDDAVQLAEYHAAPDSSDPWLECRDAALVELLYGCGLRVGELVGLDVQASAHAKGWIDFDAGEAHVLGKGSKRRSVPVGGKALEAMQAWVAVREQGLTPSTAEQTDVHWPSWHALDRASRVATLAFAQLESGFVHAGASAHVAPFIRQPCAAVQPRFAGRARVTRARQHHHHAGVHAAGFSALGPGL
jgi:integrase/recombinase XerC